MRSIKIINDVNDIKLSNDWTHSLNFKSKDRIVKYKGHSFRLADKKERDFPCLERTRRIFLGIFLSAATLFLALISKSVRRLFKDKETIHYAVPPIVKTNLNFPDNDESAKPLPPKPVLEAREALGDLNHINIPKSLDIRGSEWLTSEHLHDYTKYLGSKYPELLVHAHEGYTFKNIVATILHDGHFDQAGPCNHEDYGVECSGKTVLAYPLNVTKDHWVLTLVDRQKRTIEYYDSLKDYGNHSEIVGQLKKLESILTKKDSGKTPYKFICKINKSLQTDGYQCGPWSLYFLENRLKDPEIDFNQLDVEESQKMIADYRKAVLRQLLILAGIIV